MDFDLWAYIIVGLIVAVIAGFIIHRNESLYSYLKERIKRYFGKLDVPVTSNGIIINVRAPYEIPIGSFTNITATFRGTLTRGFFSCQIVDCFEKDSWSPATSTLRNLDINRQTGVLNFINEKRTETWAIKPEPTLTTGKGKLIIGVFEERDFVKNGHI